MTTNTFYGLMDIIILGCGLYIMYAYYLLMAKNEIKTGVLISQKVGLTAVISGGIGLYQDYVAPVNTYLYVGFFVLFFIVMIWFVVSIRKSEKLFW